MILCRYRQSHVDFLKLRVENGSFKAFYLEDYLARSQRSTSAPKPHTPSITSALALKRLKRLLDEIPEVRSAGPRSAKIDTWKSSTKIVLSDFYGEDSVAYKQFLSMHFAPYMSIINRPPESVFLERLNSGLDKATGFIKSRITDLQEQAGSTESIDASSYASDSESRKVFVVHGHDYGNKETVARFLEKLDLESIILHEQSDEGRTVIEKFEDHASDVRCAVVILTADDIGASKLNPEKQEHRAR
jgi:hypothetical protein